jgi:hypothetical protein
MSLLNPQANDPANPGQFPSPINAINRVLRGGNFPTLTAINTGDITLLINPVNPDAAKAFNFAAAGVRLLSCDGLNQLDPTKGVEEGLNKLLEIKGDILNQVAEDLKPLLEETNLVLGQLMQPIKNVLAFLSTLGPLPKLDVHIVSRRCFRRTISLFLVPNNIKGCRFHHSRQPDFRSRDVSCVPVLCCGGHNRGVCHSI